VIKIWIQATIPLSDLSSRMSVSSTLWGCPYKMPAVRGKFDQCGHFANKGEGILQMPTSALFGAKKLYSFRNLWCLLGHWVSADVIG